MAVVTPTMAAPTGPWWRNRVESFPLERLHSLAVGAVLVVVSGVLHGLNMASAPQRVDDEGTYVAQAWAVEHFGSLGHYTYWYDHPPLGWLQLSAWTWTTGAFERAPHAVAAGREAMLVVHLVSVALLWVLARRLGLTRWAATAAVGLFAFSPLAVQFHRQVLLDNLAMPWVLAAFALAASPRRRLGEFAVGGVCFGVAVLTKETSLLFLPALAWQLWRSAHLSTRRYAISVSASLFVLVCAFYVLYATVKHELVPSGGRVSLLDGVRFQLFERATSGSVFDPDSVGHRTVAQWLDLDLVGPVLALVAAPVALVAVPRLRPVAVAFLVLAAMVVRPGYLPVPLVIGLLPFGALVVAGVADAAWRWPGRKPAGHVVRPLVVPVVLVAAIAAAVAAPAWVVRHRGLVDADLDAPMREAQRWIVDNVPTDRRLIVDDALWVDLVESGFPADDVVWFYKLDTDPQVQALAPDGWRDYDVVVSTQSVRTFPESFPEVDAALRNSALLAVFGTGAARVEVRKVLPDGPDEAAAVDDLVATGRTTLGADLARNPSLELTPTARRRLLAGEVDERVMTALVALAVDRALHVDGFPIDPAEQGTDAPRRMVELEAATAADAGEMAELLREQDDPYRPAEVEQDDARLTVTYPVAALT